MLAGPVEGREGIADVSVRRLRAQGFGKLMLVEWKYGHYNMLTS